MSTTRRYVAGLAISVGVLVLGVVMSWKLLFSEMLRLDRLRRRGERLTGTVSRLSEVGYVNAVEYVFFPDKRPERPKFRISGPSPYVEALVASLQGMPASWDYVQRFPSLYRLLDAPGGRSLVSTSYYRSLNLGKSVTVTFDRETGEHVVGEVDAARVWGYPWVAGAERTILPWAFVVGGLLSLVAGVRELLKLRRAASELAVANAGVPAEGSPVRGNGIPSDAKTCPDRPGAAVARTHELAENGCSIAIAVGGLTLATALVLVWLRDYHRFETPTLFLLFFGLLLFFGCRIGKWVCQVAGNRGPHRDASAKGRDGAPESETTAPDDPKE